MAYVNGTTHYNLPQTVGTDKRDWADTNQSFADVDAALFGAVDDVAQAQTEIDALTGRMNTAEQNISTNTGDIAGLDTRLTTAEGAITSQQSQITDLRQDTEDMICAFNEPSATSTHTYAVGDYFIYNDVLYRATQSIAIGDTIVPDTNCSTTNVTTEIQSIEDLSGDVNQLQTDMTAVQNSINDINNTAIPNNSINRLSNYDSQVEIGGDHYTVPAAGGYLFLTTTATGDSIAVNIYIGTHEYNIRATSASTAYSSTFTYIPAGAVIFVSSKVGNTGLAYFLPTSA